MKPSATIFVFLALVYSCSTVYSQQSNLAKEARLDSVVNQYSKEYSIVGLAVGVVNDGLCFSKGYGHTDLTKTHPVSETTMFHMASVSKLFTATAIMQLVAQKKLSLEDKLFEVLPRFKMRDKRYREISIKHLLTHSSGLKWNNRLESSPDDSTSLPLFLENLQKQKLNFKPGEKLSYETYSNVGFDLLGILIEHLSGITFDRYVKENILTPIGMHESTYYYEDIDTSSLAFPQIIAGDSKQINRLNQFGIDDKKKPLLNGEPLELSRYDVYGEDYEHNPSGNLISSTSEMNLWIKHCLDIYNQKGNDGVLSHATLSQMWSTQMDIKDSQTSIGLGWWIYEDEKFGTAMFHVGNNPGFCSIQMIYPERNFGFTIVCNGWYAQEAVWHKIADQIAEIYLRD